MRKIIISICLILPLICSCSGKSETALDWFNKSVATNYNDPKKAIEYLNNAIKLKPDYTDAYYNRGVAYVSLGQHKLAIEDFSNVIKLQPNSANAYNNRGLAYAGIMQYQLATQDYNKAISINPNFASAYAGRGSVYIKQGNKNQGCLDVKKACELGNCKLSVMATKKGYCR